MPLNTPRAPGSARRGLLGEGRVEGILEWGQEWGRRSKREKRQKRKEETMRRKARETREVKMAKTEGELCLASPVKGYTGGTADGEKAPGNKWWRNCVTATAAVVETNTWEEREFRWPRRLEVPDLPRDEVTALQNHSWVLCKSSAWVLLTT